MISLKHLLKIRRVAAALSLTVGIAGCALTATRPVQEMSNADAAIRAAKDVNADSLTPEIFRIANENYFKAKREYRLKNFDKARLYALKATRMAEQAEFEAYRLGGATPELATRSAAPEGASPDSDSALTAIRLDAPMELKKANSKEPELPPEVDKETGSDQTKGTEYNEYVRQLEEEKTRLDAERTKADAERARLDSERAKDDLEAEKIKNASPSNPQLQLINSSGKATF